MATTPRTEKEPERGSEQAHAAGAGQAPAQENERKPEERSRHEAMGPSGAPGGMSGGGPRPEGNRPPSGPPPMQQRMGPPKPTRGQQVHTWLAHPLLLLVIGALMTGIIVPTITGKWQRNQTAQDMKTQVIGDVTSAVSIPMTQLSVTQNPVLAGNGGGSIGGNGGVAGTYSAFRTKADSVDSEIRAYFPENNIPMHWENLVGLLQNYYLLTYANNPQLKAGYIGGILHYFQVHHQAGGIDWHLLANGSWHDHGYYHNWTELGKKILGVKSVVLSDIMDAPAPSF